jgi:hypothetical protein
VPLCNIFITWGGKGSCCGGTRVVNGLSGFTWWEVSGEPSVLGDEGSVAGAGNQGIELNVVGDEGGELNVAGREGVSLVLWEVKV